MVDRTGFEVCDDGESACDALRLRVTDPAVTICSCGSDASSAIIWQSLKANMMEILLTLGMRCFS